MSNDLVTRLRTLDAAAEIGAASDPTAQACLAQWQQSGVGFVSADPELERQYWRAVRELFSCVKPTGDFGPILQEGGVYFGCWLESTGTINAEILSRFLPDVAQNTFVGFARGQREDGLLPYKLTADGPSFQPDPDGHSARPLGVEPLSAQRQGQDISLRMYAAMSAHDAWIAKWRNTRGTGAVEAFCCFDTGHDLSARFWHVPDTPYMNDPTRCDPDNPLVPFIAPDLTANIACQRKYLGYIAEEIGAAETDWADKSQTSVVALYAQCFDGYDRFFYDRDRNKRQVKIQTDVLLRVLACEIGNDAFFQESLEHYLLNTQKFFAKYPFTSVALTDPRFDPSSDHNTWCGTSNLLSLIRAPHAFEAHHRYVELNFALQPALSALFDMERFAQTINPFTGAPGFTQSYSPAMLGLIDFVERLSGVLPRPDGTVWFTGLVPKSVTYRQVAHETAYSRRVDGVRFELVNGAEGATIFRDGALLYSFPRGMRLVTDRAGDLVSLIGMSVSGVEGKVSGPQGEVAFKLGPNEQIDFRDGERIKVRAAGFVPISF